MADRGWPAAAHLLTAAVNDTSVANNLSPSVSILEYDNVLPLSLNSRRVSQAYLEEFYSLT